MIITVPTENYSYSYSYRKLFLCSLITSQIFSLTVLGDGVAVPSKFNIIERQTKITASVDSCSKSELSAFENGGNYLKYNFYI